MPDIDLDFPRDIREKLIVRVDGALRPRARRARRDASRRTARAARSATSARRSACRSPTSSGSRSSPTAGTQRASATSSLRCRTRRRKLASPRWRAFARAVRGDRRPPASHLAAPGRDGDLVAAARRARARPAGGDGGTADVPVGQGLVRRRRLPEDRPARARDALGGRGVRRPDRAAPRREDRPLAHPARRSRTSSRRSSRRTPSAASRSRAARRCRRSCARAPRTSTTSPCRSRSCGRGRSRARRCTRTSSGAQKLRDDPATSRRPTTRCCEEPLRETLGVVVFQDQVLDVADPSRRLHRRRGGGAAARDEPQALACGARVVPRAVRRRRARERCRRGGGARASTTSSSAFSGFGFPKSHSAAFGLLAYQSAWLRHHYGAEFLAALLNAQPMGFYPPATLVRDAQRHGVETRTPDVNRSEVECTIEDGAVRVGLKYVQGVGEDDAEAVVGVAAVRVHPRARAADAAVRRRAARARRVAARATACRAASGASSSLAARARPAAQTVPGSGGEEKQLALPLEPTVATPDLPEPTRVGADARRLPHDEPLGRRASARAHAPAPAAGHALDASSCASARTARACRSPAWSSRASARRPRTASSSCCSRTSTRRSNLIVPPKVYDRFRGDRARRAAPPRRAAATSTPTATATSLVDELVSLGPLARELAARGGRDAHLLAARPHHFGTA